MMITEDIVLSGERLVGKMFCFRFVDDVIVEVLERFLSDIVFDLPFPCFLGVRQYVLPGKIILLQERVDFISPIFLVRE